jgi:hypothetical protein
MLALQDSTPLVIKNFNWNNDLIENEIKNGSIKLSGLCQRGLSRVKTFTGLDLALSPNPSDDIVNLKISNTGKEPTDISIYTLQGIKKAAIHIDSPENDINMNLNLDDYTEGIYTVVVRNNHYQLTERMVVIK